MSFAFPKKFMRVMPSVWVRILQVLFNDLFWNSSRAQVSQLQYCLDAWVHCYQVSVFSKALSEDERDIFTQQRDGTDAWNSTDCWAGADGPRPWASCSDWPKSSTNGFWRPCGPQPNGFWKLIRLARSFHEVSQRPRVPWLHLFSDRQMWVMSDHRLQNMLDNHQHPQHNFFLRVQVVW